MRAQFICQHILLLGRRIPEDVLILGVGDDTMICELNDPTLSSIPYRKTIGIHAAAAESHFAA